MSFLSEQIVLRLIICLIFLTSFSKWRGKTDYRLKIQLLQFSYVSQNDFQIFDFPTYYVCLYNRCFLHKNHKLHYEKNEDVQLWSCLAIYSYCTSSFCSSKSPRRTIRFLECSQSCSIRCRRASAPPKMAWECGRLCPKVTPE